MKLRTQKIEEWITITMGTDTARVLIQPLTPKDTARLLEEATESEWERGQRFEKVNFYIFRVLKTDFVIRDWDVQDENGNAIPCTRPWKETVYQNNPTFIEKVLDKAEKLAEKVVAQEAELSKNS